MHMFAGERDLKKNLCLLRHNQPNTIHIDMVRMRGVVKKNVVVVF